MMKLKKQAWQTLEYGEGKEGYWTSDRFMSQIKEAAKIEKLVSCSIASLSCILKLVSYSIASVSSTLLKLVSCSITSVSCILNLSPVPVLLFPTFFLNLPPLSALLT